MNSSLCHSFQYQSNNLTLSKSKLFRNKSIDLQDNHCISEFLFLMERREALKEIDIDGETDEEFDEISEIESSSCDSSEI